MNRKTALFALTSLLVGMPGYAQQKPGKPDIVPDNIKFFQDILARQNDPNRRYRWDPAKVFYIASPASKVVSRSYTYDAEREVLQIFAGRAEYVTSEKNAGVEVAVELDLLKKERTPQGAQIANVKEYAILLENTAAVRAQKVEIVTPIPKRADLNLLRVELPMKPDLAKQVAPNLRVVLGVRFAGWDSFFRRTLTPIEVPGPPRTLFRAVMSAGRATVVQVLVVDTTTGKVWKTIPIGETTAAAPGGKRGTLPPPPPEPESPGLAPIEGAGSAQRVSRGFTSVADSGTGPAPGRKVATVPTPLEPESRVIPIPDFSAWLDVLASRAVPGPRDEFETTAEYNKRIAAASASMDPNQIYTVAFAPEVLPEKTYAYDADTENLTLFGSGLGPMESVIALQKSAERLEVLRATGQGLRAFGDWQRGGSVYLSGIRGLVVGLKMPRDTARAQAKNLRLRLGFQVPDPRAAVVVRENPIGNVVRSVEVRLVFVEVFHLVSGELVARIPVSTRTEAGKESEEPPIGPVGRVSRANRDARPTSSPVPKLTDEMKQRKLNAKITVSVEVDVDGSHIEEVVTGSGDDEVDALILSTMKRWKWSPAIVEGTPTKQKFRYRFTISAN